MVPSITNNSIKHQSFVYTHLNGQTVLFQFSISHSFALSLNVKQFYQVLPLQAREDIGVISMKGHSAFRKAPALLKPHH